MTYAGGAVTAPLQLSNTTSRAVATFSAGNATIANAFVLSSTGAIISTFTNGTATNQTTTLSGKISGGNAAAGTIFQFSGPTNDSTGFVLTNPLNDFTATVEVDEGVLGITSNGAWECGQLAVAVQRRWGSGRPAVRRQ